MLFYQNILPRVGIIFSKLKKIAFGVGVIAIPVLAGNTMSVKEAQAGWDIKPTATGVGYGRNKREAYKYARAAWTEAVRDTYGRRYASLRTARSQHTICVRIGRGDRTIRERKRVLGAKGNVNHPYTCTLTAQPARYIRERCPSSALGIGYHNVEAGAQGLAIRAWSNAVRKRCGWRYADFNRASSKDITCVRLGKRTLRGGRAAIIGTEGNPNSRYSCTAEGRPRR